ncbi:MAG: alpha/beta fold hydrolase [Chloroflexi bacterium]|nr:alpha/beta fold hydrolase [Chloroflexota bacterium]
MAQPVEKFVQVGDYNTRYLEAGEGEPVLLLHPACPGAHGAVEYRSTIGPLSEHFRVLAPDLIGFGGTDSPTQMLKHPTYVEHIVGFMKAVGATPAHLIGNCRGGLVAISVAGEYPELVRRLILIGNAGGGVPPELEERALKPYSEFQPTRENLQASLSRCYFDAATHVPGDAFDALFDASVRQYDAYAKLGGYPMDVPNLKPLLAQMTVPTLFICGRDDKVLTLEQAVRGYAMTPGARLYVMPNCGLHPQIEHPEEFNHVALEFLQGELTPAEATAPARARELVAQPA